MFGHQALHDARFGLWDRAQVIESYHLPPNRSRVFANLCAESSWFFSSLLLSINLFLPM